MEKKEFTFFADNIVYTRQTRRVLLFTLVVGKINYRLSY